MALCELIHEDGACVDYVVVDANAQYAIHTGLPRTEVIGRRASTLFESAEAPYLRECSAAVAGRARVRFDIYSARLRRHFSLLVVPVGPNSFGMVPGGVRDQIRIDDEWAQKTNATRDSY